MLNRRELVKKSLMAGVGIYSIPGLLTISGCSKKTNTVENTVDAIITSLNVADQVAKATQSIFIPVNPELGEVLGSISANIELVIKTYHDYETVADASVKQNALVLVQATIVGISTNLSALLEAVHVKNPTLLTTISVAVAIINSAITVLLNSLPAQMTTSARSVIVPSADKLPIFTNASAANLKAAWNNVIITTYPERVIK